MSALQPARKTRNSMSVCDPTPANGSRRMWTERDDDLPAFMADMLATAIAAEMLETTKAHWQYRSGEEVRRRGRVTPPQRVADVSYLVPRHRSA